MDLFFVGEIAACGKLEPVVRIVKALFDLLRFIIPIALLIFGALDLAKAVIASDEKEIKGATNKFVKRAIAAIAVFFAVTLVDIIMGLVGDSSTGTKDDKAASKTSSEDWFECWKEI